MDDFKKTPIGKIPEDWEVVRLGDVSQIVMGQAPPSTTYNNEGVGLPFLQGKAEFGEIYPSPKVYCSKPIKVAEKNDILLSVRAPVGDVNLAPFRCCIGRGLAAVRVKKERLNYLFLFYYLKLNGKKFENLSSGSTFKAIKKEDIENFPILLPPLEEQRKIAEILSTVDKAIEKVDEAIAKTERLKKGLMQELLTKGIGHTEFKDTEIGRIPKEWKVVRLGNIASFKNGLNFSQESRGRGILFINVPDVFSEGIYIDPNKLERADFGNPNKISQYYLKPGDLLFVRSSVKREGVGWVSMFKGCKEPVVFCGFLIRARIEQNEISSEFLTYLLRYDRYRKLLVSGSGTVAITNITQESLKSLKIPLPPIEEQQKIAEILSTVDKKLELERKRKEKLERIKKGLMNDLLTGRRRVKVETNG